MIHPLTDLKFKVLINLAGFSPKKDDFNIVVKNIYGQTKYTYSKEDMLTDGFGSYYIMMDAVPRGSYFAILAAQKVDEDFMKGYQVIIDKQHLVNVGLQEHPYCHRGKDGDCTDGMNVTYQRVWSVNLDDGVYLADKDGNLILTSDGQRIRFQNTSGDDQPAAAVRLGITGEEFKRMIEERTEDGKINSLSELLDTQQNMPDDTEVTLASDEDIDDMMERVLG